LPTFRIERYGKVVQAPGHGDEYGVRDYHSFGLGRSDTDLWNGVLFFATPLSDTYARVDFLGHILIVSFGRRGRGHPWRVSMISMMTAVATAVLGLILIPSWNSVAPRLSVQ